MSIRTITESEAPNRTIPATDDLLRGWVGPAMVYCSLTDRWQLIAVIGSEGPDAYACIDAGREASYGDRAVVRPVHRLRLPLARPEVQAHLVGWLGRGERCEDHDRACKLCGELSGSRRPCASDVIGGHEWADLPCETCNGSGYIRPPADLYHLLIPEDLGGLPDWIRLALIWGSVVRVAAGMGPVSTIWTPIYGDKNPTRRWFRNYAGGPFQETSFAYNDTESAARDSRLIRAGCTLVDDTPTGRVIRFEVPDAG